MYYFIRVNDYSVYSDRSAWNYGVLREQPESLDRCFSRLGYCFENDIVRIGWSETGDLSFRDNPELAVSGRDVGELPAHIKKYLVTFRDIQVGSTILVPDKQSLGDIYIAEVTRTYHYFHDTLLQPQEYSHRVGVRWDRHPDGTPTIYRAAELAISAYGGFWCRALYEIDKNRSSGAIIGKIDACRGKYSLTPSVRKQGAVNEQPHRPSDMRFLSATATGSLSNLSR